MLFGTRKGRDRVATRPDRSGAVHRAGVDRGKGGSTGRDGFRPVDAARIRYYQSVRAVSDQREPEYATGAESAADADIAAHCFDQPFGERKTDAGTFLRTEFLPRAIERLKEHVNLVGSNARAVIGDADADAVRRDGGHSDGDSSCFSTVFDGIRE